MVDLLLGVGVWLGISVVAVLMFGLGAAVGRRGAWEEGYRFGLGCRSDGDVDRADAQRRVG